MFFQPKIKSFKSNSYLCSFMMTWGQIWVARARVCAFVRVCSLLLLFFYSYYYYWYLILVHLLSLLLSLSLLCYILCKKNAPDNTSYQWPPAKRSGDVFRDIFNLLATSNELILNRRFRHGDNYNNTVFMSSHLTLYVIFQHAAH